MSGVRPPHDQPGTRSAQGLVRGGGGDVGDVDGAGIEPGGDQSRDMGDVGDEIGPDPVGDVPEALPVDHPRVGRKAGHDELRFVLQGEPFRLIVVDLLGLGVQPVLDCLVNPAGDVDARAMGQVAAVRQAHPHDGVAGIDQGEVDGPVGLRAGMRLDIGETGAEELLGAIDRELLHHVHVLAAPVITLAGITLRVLVGQDRALGLQHPRAHVVFRGDELDVVFLALALSFHGPRQIIIESRDRHCSCEHNSSSASPTRLTNEARPSKPNRPRQTRVARRSRPRRCCRDCTRRRPCRGFGPRSSNRPACTGAPPRRRGTPGSTASG